MEDKSQLMAINHESGPALVLAGPGSGKTYVLTHHILFLINSLGVSPDNILVITFTKEAAKSMRQKFNILSNKYSEVTFGTFHSVFYAFLRSFFRKDFKIIDKERSLEYIKRIRETDKDVEEYSSLISAKKAGKCMVKACLPEDFFEVLSEYNSVLTERNELDYDDILIKCHEMLSDSPDTGKILGEKYKYILIDEFQDISSLQYEIIRLILKEPYNIFAVGDEDQSIYSFRGASAEIIRKYISDYEKVSVYELTKNYRSNEEIFTHAVSLIKNNSGRLRSKEISCVDEIKGDHFYISYSETLDEMTFRLTEDVHKTLASDISCAILVRTNKDVNKYKRMFSKNNFAAREALYEIVCEHICDYLQFILEKDRISFLKILNVPDRFLQSSLFKDAEIDLKKSIIQTKNIKYKNALYLFNNQLEMLEKCTPIAFVIYLWNVCGLKNIYSNSYDQKDIQEVFGRLSEIAKSCERKETMLERIKRQQALKKEAEIIGNLTILTYHGSKGLEFDAVFLPDILEGHVPSRASVVDTNTEEERRLFYVAMTRARSKLFLYTAVDKKEGSLIPSRFIEEIK